MLKMSILRKNVLGNVTASTQIGAYGDAGELPSLAQTLNFTLQLLQGAPVCQPASN